MSTSTTSPAPLPPHESDRLDALRRYNILDSDPEQAFDDITQLAAQLCETPMSVISFVDEHRQWFKSRVCVGLTETDRDIAFCAHAILEPDILIVPDTLEDPRFANNPLVTGEPYQRFYAGALIRSSDGQPIGTLCVMDTEPRILTENQTTGLKALARQVNALLELRRGQRRLAHELVQRDEDLADLVSTLPGIIYQCENKIDWPMTLMDGRVEEISGYTAEQFLTQALDWGDLIHPEDKESVWDTIQEALGRKERFEITYRITDKHGREKYLWEQGLGLYDRNGELIALQGFITDATAQQELQFQEKRLTQELVEREASLAHLIDTLPGIVYQCRNDEFWTMEFIGGQCYEITGYRPEQFLGNAEISFAELQLPEEQAALQQAVDQAIAHKEPYEVAYTLITKDGERRTMWERGVGIFDEEGELTALQGFITDITEPSRDREALAQSEAQSRAMLEALPDMMFRISHEGIYLDIHTPALAETPFPREMFIGNPIHKVLPRETAKLAYAAIEEAFITGQVQTVQYSLDPNEYSLIPRHYEARVNKISEAEVIVLVRDITEKAQAETQLARQNDALHTLNDISQAIAAELDLKQILGKLCEGATSLLDATSAYYSDWDTSAGTSTVLAEHFSEQATEQERISDLGATYDIESELGTTPEWIFTLKRAHSQTIESPTLSAVERKHMVHYGTQAVLSLPVISEGQALGLLEVYESRYQRVFTDSEVDLLVSLVNQTAVAIEKAQLFNQAEQELQERIDAEDALRQAQAISVEFQDKLNALLEINVQLSEITELSELYKQAIILGRKRLGFDRLGLLLYDEATMTMRGTFGTDSAGQLRDERSFHQPVLEDSPLWEQLHQKTRTKIWDNANLWDDGEVIGTGWNCTALLLQENNILGFLSADNLFKQEPLKPYQGELMALYAGTLAQLVRRLQTQNVLLESEERNRILVEQSPLAVIRWDMNFCVTEWNTAAERIFGHTRAEALGQHARFILTEETWPLIDDIWHHLTHLSGGERSTNANVTATGRTITCEWYNTTLLDEDGHALGVVSIVDDVTEQRAAEATLRYQAAILDQIADAVISTDMTFTVRSWNKAAERVYGYPAEEVLNHNVGDFIETIYVGREAGDVFQELMEKGSLLGARSIQKIKNGRELIIDTSPVLIRNEQGEPSGLVAVNRDVTAQVQNERERERLLEVMENATDFIGLANASGQVLFINRAGRELVGVSPTADLTADTMFTIHPERHHDRLRNELISTAVDEGSWQGEFFLQHQAGHEIPVSMSLVAHHDSQDEVSGFSAVIRDITAERATQETRRRRQTFNEASLRLTTSNTLQKQGLLPALQEITAEAAHTLGVGRASIWLYDNTNLPAIELLDLYQKEENQHSDGFRLTQQDAPAYFLALQNERILVANDIHTHYSTQDLIAGYLQPLGITSMLDALARTGDNVRAVLCLEHTGPPRAWLTEEQDFANSLADLISLRLEADERRQLETQIRDSLERRSRQVHLSTQIAQEISSSTELFELYQRVVELVKEQFGYYHTQLLQYNPALDAVALVVGYGEIGEKMLATGHAIPMGTGIIGTAASTGKSVLISNVQQEANWRAHPLLPHTRSELAVPIVFGSRVLGVLDIQDDAHDSLSPEDQILLEGLCGQIATAIESTRLRQDMAEQLKELNNLQRLISRDAWQSYQATQETTQLGYLFDRANIKPLEGGNGHGHGHTVPYHTHLDDPETVVLKPIKIRGETIGAIGIQDMAEQPLSQDEQELLDSITLQVAEALENARLLEQTQKRAIELETVAQVSAASSTILEVSQLLKSVVDLTKSGFGLYHAHIYLYEPESRDMALAAGAGEIGDIMVAEGWRIPLHSQRSLVARASRAQQGLVITDTRNDPDFLPNPLLPNTRAELIAPMIVGDRLLGVLDLQADRVNYFSQDDLRIHTTLASQVAIALQNANLYQEQRETAEKLREVDILKSEFLASMSHELRTPLNSIIGFADVLLEGIDGELNERMEEDVQLIRDGGQHLRALIGDILDMSKIEAGMMDLNYSLIDVAGLANEVMATTRGLLTNKPVKAHLFVDPRLEVVEADRVRLVQILLNLLSNAAKFTDEGEVALSMEQQGENMFVSVKDSGIGIREEDISQVFEQFRQIGGMALRKAGGTGLGMPITKKLVELHHGDIWLESTFGSGTTFYFTVPLHQPENAADTRQGYYS